MTQSIGRSSYGLTQKWLKRWGGGLLAATMLASALFLLFFFLLVRSVVMLGISLHSLGRADHEAQDILEGKYPVAHQDDRAATRHRR
jgi:hypothetical protein